ncbi:E3 ubiquitin-protein ligase TRIM33-like [Mytilus edulis]|uniref:E3 ubiquitin-protein ligase TRIM33-like n=1 Tax=Mytilus edulis TaxID=6550 RepID=UPI0039EECDE4
MGNNNTVVEADTSNCSNVEADPFDSSNNVEFCRPCNKQENKNHAAYWCTSCPELLCQTCYVHHRVLKATQDHKLLSIDDYHMIGSSIAESISQKEARGSGRNVQLKEDRLKKKDIRQDLSSTIKTMTTTIEKVRTDLHNNQLDSSVLEKNRTLFHYEMIIGRQRVEHFLNEIENDVRQKYEIAFTTSKQIVQENMSKIEYKLNVLQKRTKTAENIKEFDFSESQINLINKKFQQDNMEDKMQIENLINGMKNVSIVANPVFTVNVEAKQITVGNGFQVYHSEGINNHPEIDEIESSSSTIEAEADRQ